MRRLHGPCRRRGDTIVLLSGERSGRQADHHHRGPRPEQRAAQGAEGLDRSRRSAMRLLPERHDHGGGGASQGEAQAVRRRHRQGHHQHLPLRHLSAGPRRHPRRDDERWSVEEKPMNHVAKSPEMNRRSFVVSAAAAGGGLALGFELPLGPNAAEGAETRPQVSAGVVIRPDETGVSRIARSEMGQGTLTGLAQLFAEELECDWSKVTYEFPPPGQNVARKRVWGDFFTAGSQGIRSSNELVRKGGAAARMMLIEAAANEWKVPAAECTAAAGTITPRPGAGLKRPFGTVAAAAGKREPPAEIKLKDPKDWKVIGQGKKRLDTPVQGTGGGGSGIDIPLTERDQTSPP